MNIKQHIEAGHYPTDAKGRAIVPTQNPEWEAVIVATDAPGSWPLLGWLGQKNHNHADVFSWHEGGEYGSPGIIPLLPPPPRKVRVTRWIVVNERGQAMCPAPHSGLFDERKVAAAFASCHLAATIVELTGEYEEPWA